MYTLACKQHFKNGCPATLLAETSETRETPTTTTTQKKKTKNTLHKTSCLVYLFTSHKLGESLQLCEHGSCKARCWFTVGLIILLNLLHILEEWLNLRLKSTKAFKTISLLDRLVGLSSAIAIMSENFTSICSEEQHVFTVFNLFTFPMRSVLKGQFISVSLVLTEAGSLFCDGPVCLL